MNRGHDRSAGRPVVADPWDSEERFRRIFEDGPLGVVLADLQARIECANRRFCTMLGYSQDELIELGIRGFTHPDDWEADRQLGSRLLRGEIPTYRLDKRYLRKDGQVMWGQLTTSMLHDSEGRPTHIIGMVEDITERRNAEQALRESERRLHTLLANLPGMAYRCRNDANWSMEFVSGGCLQLTGYQASELVGNRMIAYGDVIRPEDQPAVCKQVQQALARRQPFQMEYRIKTAQGEEKWVWEQGVGVFAEDGELQALEGFITDITAQKRAQAASRESERRLATLIANLPGAVYRCRADANWTIEFLSDGYRALTGIEPASLLGQTGFRHAELIHPEDRQREFETMQDAIAQKRQFQVEYRLRTVSGEEKWLWEQGTGVYSEDGELAAIEGFTTDISDQKRAEQELRRVNEGLEQRVLERTAELTQANQQLLAEVAQRRQAEEELAIFRRFVEAATQGFGMADPEGHLIYVNPFLARLFGAPSQEAVIGRHISAYYPGDYLPRREQEILPALRRGEPWQGEQGLLFPDGQWHPTLHTIFPVQGDRGELLCTAAVITDITDLKRSETQLKAKQRTLQRMVQAGDLERRLITYELHDGVAQQLMAATMLFQSKRLRTEWKSAQAEAAYRDGLKSLRQASSEIRRVMNWLRTPVLDKYGLTEAIADVAAQLRSAAGAPEIQFSHAVHFERLEPTLENTLFRIAQESLTNACRHSKSKQVAVKLTQRGAEVTLEVRDWGVGFNPREVRQNRIGLEGLRERARILGGKLSIRSKPGQGTVIRVKFPVIEAPS